METQKSPAIYFYIPQNQWPSHGIPDNIDFHWQIFGTGIFATTLQTYIRLKADGFCCELTSKIPTQGIVIAHRDSIPCHWRPNRKLLFVCIQADRAPHPWAQIHVVHNPQSLLNNKSFNISSGYYIPHWAPQPGLIPRNPARGSRFENIAFFGHPRNLAPELKQPSWEQALQELGLRWRVVSSHQWNDYSNVDAVVAVRSFDSQDYTVKPALKLYNAWHAGVPAILGQESAFQVERKSNLDYLEATSVSEAIAFVKRLRDDKQLYHSMVENGRNRAEETRHSVQLKMWRDFLQGTAIPAYKNWLNAPILQQQKFFMTRSMSYNFERIQRHASQAYNFVFQLTTKKQTPLNPSENTFVPLYKSSSQI